LLSIIIVFFLNKINFGYIFLLELRNEFIKYIYKKDKEEKCYVIWWVYYDII